MRDVSSCLLFAAILAGTAPAFADGPAAPRVPALLAALDADRDGRLTQSEMHAAREQQIAEFDGDRDGRLSAGEYQAWWVEAARARLARQFRADDRDKDGSVTLEELVERSDDLLRRRDLDRDGVLTAEELRPRRGVPRAG
jgi:Ca2+-binding EF-hand superfamily protein